jgi:hypothetical protein
MIILKSERGLSTLIIMAFVALLLVGAIIVAPIVNRPPTESNPSTSSPTLGTGVDDQSISILYLSAGDIELENLKKSPELISCSDLAESITRCELRSPLVARPNLVVIKEGKLLYKRTITTPLANGRLPSFGNLSSGLGAAGQVQKGSRFFGAQFQTYIFASKGVTLIANPETGEVQEVQVYQPSSVSEYLTTHGEDIRGYTASALSPI